MHHNRQPSNRTAYTIIKGQLATKNLVATCTCIVNSASIASIPMWIKPASQNKNKLESLSFRELALVFLLSPLYRLFPQSYRMSPTRREKFKKWKISWKIMEKGVERNEERNRKAYRKSVKLLTIDTSLQSTESFFYSFYILTSYLSFKIVKCRKSVKLYLIKRLVQQEGS